MGDSWPGQWHSKVDGVTDLPAGERTGPSYVNDNGIRCLLSDEAEEYLWMDGDIPENTC